MVFDAFRRTLGGPSSPAMEVLQGRDRVISFPGTSQFRVQGVSACGLAALNFARIAFRIVKDHSNILDILDMIASRETVEEVISICAGWSSNLHLEVEDIVRVPIFMSKLSFESTYFGPPSVRHFKTVLQGIRDIQEPAAVIITRPPEIIACFKVADNDSGQNIFVIFDSHPRPSHPRGAGLVFSSSMDQTAKTLSNILHVDKDLLSSPDLQWEAQLLTNCSGHVFVAKNGVYNAEQTILELSLELRMQINDLKLQINAANLRNIKLEQEVAVLQNSIQQERLDTRKTIAFTEKSIKIETNSRQRFTQEDEPSGSSQSQVIDRTPWPQVQSKPPPPPSKTKPIIRDDPALQESQETLNTALLLQKKYDAEDAELRRQHRELSSYMQMTFKCSICLEDHPEDNAAQVDGCGHMTCRLCMKDFIKGKILEHRFPIVCPICSADGCGRPAEISSILVEQMGITESEYDTWVEMQLSIFSILLHCRKCNRSVFVDREDYNELPTIVCPMHDCTHAWCKACHRTIEPDGPKHSCDGSNELDHLMKEQGWKYCPNCRTPIQKEHGCNHMTCITPGCNSHFCYICGELIVRSALRDEISDAVTTHFTKCQLFEVPD